MSKRSIQSSLEETSVETSIKPVPPTYPNDGLFPSSPKRVKTALTSTHEETSSSVSLISPTSPISHITVPSNTSDLESNTSFSKPAGSPKKILIDSTSVFIKSNIPQPMTLDLGITTLEAAGILAYMSPSLPGWSGEIKSRFEDFLVNEVDMKGTVLRIQKIGQLSPTQLDLESKRVDSQGEISNERGFASLVEVLGSEMTQKIKTFISSPTSKENGSIPSLTTKPILDKVKRTQVHQICKLHFSSQLVTSTKEGCVVLSKGKLGKRDHKRSLNWNDLGGPFCKFLMYKENCDSMEAIGSICRSLRLTPKVFGVAGTKDKRAITVQQVSAHKVKIETLRMINSQSHNGGIRLSNFEYSYEPLKLGQLSGNRFSITVREVHSSFKENISQSLLSLSEKGFINYFGLQRFGNRSVPTHFVGRELLRGEWQKAIDLILGVRDSEEPAAMKARKHWHDHGNASEALKLFPSKFSAERGILGFFKDHGKDTKNLLGAIGNIPRSLRLMFTHAYQSFIWNTVASERILKGGTQALPGDLVFDPNPSLSPASFPVLLPSKDGLLPPSIISLADSESEIILDLDESLPSNFDSLIQTETSISTTPFIHQEESRESINQYVPPSILRLTSKNASQFSIQDIILPLPGSDVLYPENDIGDLYTTLMKRDGLNPHTMHQVHKDFTLMGGYRKVVEIPQDLTWSLFRYNDVKIPLSLTDLDVMNGISIPISIEDGKYLAVLVQFNLGSSQYATMALREAMKFVKT